MLFSPAFLAISLLMGIASSFINEESPSLEAALAAKRGQCRVVLVYAHERSSPDLLRQQRLLADQREGLNERDLEQIIVIGDELSVADKQYLRGGDRKLAAETTFMTYLIGKDGGVKQRFSLPVAPQTLFRFVDSMPMRQNEMRRKMK